MNCFVSCILPHAVFLYAVQDIANIVNASIIAERHISLNVSLLVMVLFFVLHYNRKSLFQLID